MRGIGGPGFGECQKKIWHCLLNGGKRYRGEGGGGEWICGIKYGQSSSVGEKCKRDIRRDHLHP